MSTVNKKRKKIRRSKKGPYKTPHPCKVYYVNINGFRSKQVSLQKLLNDQNINVMLLAETKVYSEKGIKLEGYQLFPVVRKKNMGGGLLIAVERHGVCTSLVLSVKGKMLSF